VGACDLHDSPFVLTWNLYAEVPDLQGADSVIEPSISTKKNYSQSIDVLINYYVEIQSSTRGIASRVSNFYFI
jgi:hypothetical protein